MRRIWASAYNLTASPPLIACGGLPCMIGVNRRSIQQTGSERPATKEYASDSDCHAVGPPRTRSRQNSADMNKPKPCKGNADSALFAASRPSSLPAASFSVSSTTGQCWFMSIRRSLLRVRLKAQGSRQQQTRPRPTSSKNMRHFSKAQFCRGLSTQSTQRASGIRKVSHSWLEHEDAASFNKFIIISASCFEGLGCRF